mmetsp:Transcript_15999/g.44037  ORF Transcript_15999/g.44037 Transcript_15999/m.44037 type:complete len:110 (+) Transcript_15999:105-434(+)
MGCTSSKQQNSALQLEDSVHCLIAKDKNKREMEGQGTSQILFKPRQEHPLLTGKDEKGKDSPNPDASGHTSVTSKNDTKELLHLSAHHNTVVDPRDRIIANEVHDRVVE